MLGLVVFTQLRAVRNTNIAILSALPYLGWFGITHGVSEFLVMLTIGEGDQALISSVSTFFLVLSFVMLGMFAYRAMQAAEIYIPGYLPFILVTLFVMVPFVAGSPDVLHLEVAARYFLGLTGGIAAGAALLVNRSMLAQEFPEPIGRYVVLGAVGLFGYAVLEGVFVPASGMFPSNLVNAGQFEVVIGLSVQLFRAIAAIVIVWSIWRISEVFNIEAFRTSDRLEGVLTEDRNVIEVLQRAIAEEPSRLRGVKSDSRYVSATDNAEVGGDFFDIFPVKDGKVGILIGDVSGKGIGATRLTLVVRHTIRALAYEHNDPAVLLTKANRVVCERCRIGDFVTSLLIVVDPNSLEMRTSSAGHHFPIMVSKEESLPVPLPTSMALGAIPTTAYVADDRQLPGGTSLLLYTDGVIEARRNGEMFGIEKLIDVATRYANHGGTPVSAGAILDEVLSFAGGHLNDDAAILTFSLDQVISSDPALYAARIG